ncbi:MAG: hypothetical protein GX978_03985 [Tissierellia bacterium]|nr:hypothetical protein [Tissierellia bacterium]
MAKIYHIVIGCIQPIGLFRKTEDESRMKDYIRIYKQRTGTKNYGYSFTDDRLHLALRDHNNKARDFLSGVCDAYTYYYQNRRSSEVRIKYKMIEINPRQELFDLLRFIHNRGRNSAVEYRDYSRYIKSELVDIGPVLATLHTDQMKSKELFFEEMVYEPQSDYYIEFARREIFELDKMTKRRQRAYEFMEDFLDEIGLSRMEFLNGDHHTERVELIEKFRKETDLSYRDIGYVFELSHTSIIRLYQQKN